MLPEIACRTSSSLGSGLSSMSADPTSIIPGVQYPHCRPWCSLNAAWIGARAPPSSSPSTVVIDAAFGLDPEEGAGLHRRPVEQHRAGAAAGGVASDVRARQLELLADQVHEEEPGLDVDRVLGSVDRERDLHRRLPSSGAFAISRSGRARVVRRPRSCGACTPRFREHRLQGARPRRPVCPPRRTHHPWALRRRATTPRRSRGRSSSRPRSARSPRGRSSRWTMST